MIIPKKKESSSQFFGVSYDVKNNKWVAQRRNKLEKKMVFNGRYVNEETAAHASDTLARKLMIKGEPSHILNFPDDDTMVIPERTAYSQFIGLSYNIHRSKWVARRYSKHEKKMFSNGCYADEKTAAHASDTLARKLTANGEQSHKLNFPDDETDVFQEEESNSSQFVGVSYDVKNNKWVAQRRSKLEKKTLHNGYYDNEETAAHASDTLARQLTVKGEKTHKLNFPNDETEVFSRSQIKRKRPHIKDSGHPKND